MSIADKEEFLNVYSEKGEKIGVELRSVVHRNQLFHKEVAIWIINSNEELLLEKRSKQKMLNPNKYSLCAGHVIGDDTVEETLLREVYEEIGLDLTCENYKYVTCVIRKEIHNYCFSYHYFLKMDVDINHLNIQKDEVSRIILMKYEDFKNKVKNGDRDVALIWSEPYQTVFRELDKLLYEKRN